MSRATDRLKPALLALSPADPWLGTSNINIDRLKIYRSFFAVRADISMGAGISEVSPVFAGISNRNLSP